MTELNDRYEEGCLMASIAVRRHWWQFWLPKSVNAFIGNYTAIGSLTSVSLIDGTQINGVMINVVMDNLSASMSEVINGREE